MDSSDFCTNYQTNCHITAQLNTMFCVLYRRCLVAQIVVAVEVCTATPKKYAVFLAHKMNLRILHG